MTTDHYRTIEREGRAELREKASRFIARAFHIANDGAFAAHVAAIAREHHSSRHVCHAWVLGTDGGRHGHSDAGEPKGTAGRPILQRIQAAGITHAAVVVVRYFGGTLLGKGGLVRAYGDAAGAALADAALAERVITTTVRVQCGYGQVEPVRADAMRPHHALLKAAFGERCVLHVAVPRSQVEALAARWRLLGAAVDVPPDDQR